MDNQGYTDTAGTRINLQKRIQKTEIQGYTGIKGVHRGGEIAGEGSATLP